MSIISVIRIQIVQSIVLVKDALQDRLLSGLVSLVAPSFHHRCVYKPKNLFGDCFFFLSSKQRNPFISGFGFGSCAERINSIIKMWRPNDEDDDDILMKTGYKQKNTSNFA